MKILGVILLLLSGKGAVDFRLRRLLLPIGLYRNIFALEGVRLRDITDLFGSRVFNDEVMREKLPKETYRAMKKTIENGMHLELDVANTVAVAMKDWAISMGATHFTHWFQPMTGITAEKHDSFISPLPDGKIIMDFSGKELVRGEPDASSFPSGGLRATFEARGYTAWDPTSYAFIKDSTLCIPTAFCSYSGEALDKKTPLLRSMEAVNKQALRILNLFGNDEVHRITATVGAEQEYFLIDKEIYQKRPDLIFCGRTLFGAKPPKGQELEDHYFGAIKKRVSEYMRELDEELWKLGVLAKTRHNEVAPSQHELAPIYSNTNIACDHNQLTMELMKSVAEKHGLACLLHEKPFAGINGSGKHNNWSLSTDTGENLLEPGDTPYKNARFLLFLIAVIKAVDEHQDLIRATSSSAGNDHRLGANEAPPAIVSVFLGEELTEILGAIENNTSYNGKEKTLMEIGVTALPHFPKDTTDRNRTSPVAFTGNKFEFRMLGSNASIAGINIILNTVVAEALCEFANKLEKSENFKAELHALIVDTIKRHKRIIFNGNNYSNEWVDEAKKRGLLNLKTMVEARPYFATDENIKLFTKHGVYSEAEVHSRFEIRLENYCKIIHIEALTMIDMVRKGVIPSVISYQNEIAETAKNKKAVNGEISIRLEERLLADIGARADCLYTRLETLETSVVETKNYTDTLQLAKFYRESVFFNMSCLREVVDELEAMVGKKYWAYPTYEEILYSI